jgi:hypothetical protein
VARVFFLYLLKEAPQPLDVNLDQWLICVGLLGLMLGCQHTSTLLFMMRRPEITMYLLVYIDNIIVVSFSMSIDDRLVQQLCSEFAIKPTTIWLYFRLLAVLIGLLSSVFALCVITMFCMHGLHLRADFLLYARSDADLAVRSDDQ